MKNKIFLVLTSLLFFMASDVYAQEWDTRQVCCHQNESNFYAQILSGVNFLQNSSTNGNKASYQTGYIVSGSIGYRCQYGLRVEGEYAYRRNCLRKIHFFGQGNSKQGHFQSSSYMGNLYWDMPLSCCEGVFSNMTAYVGAGIGYDFQQIRSSNRRIVFRQKWNHFSWQLMTGLAYPIYCNTEVSLEYKFHQGGCHFNNHSIGIGITYNFNFFR